MRAQSVARFGSYFLVCIGVWLGHAAAAEAQTKVACLGEASTHSAHRTNDPEYPELMGRLLDTNFMREPTPANPFSGGMFYGGGTNYRIGNFGLPRGTVIDTTNAAADVMPTIRSQMLKDAEAFGPQAVVLGPYGAHERYSLESVGSKFLPDLRALAARVVAFPSKPTVFIALPLPRWGEDTDAERRSIHGFTAQVAREMSLPTIDLWTEFLGKRAEFDDQNHLSLAGRQRMGNFVGAAIKRWKESGSVGGGGAGGTGSGGSAAGGGAGRGGSGSVAGAGGTSGGGASSGSGGASAGAGASSGGAVGVGGSGGSSAGTAGAVGSAGSTPVANGGSPATSGGSTGAGGSPSSSGGTLSTSGGVPSTPPSSPVGGTSQGQSGTTGVMPGSPTEEAGGCSVRAVPASAGGWLAGLAGLSLLTFAARRRSSRKP
jgi:hypothetical protein